MQIQCPHCGEGFDLREARNDQDWRAFCQLLTQIPQSVQDPLLQYLELFRPAKQPNLRSGTMLKLAGELLPMILSQSISRKHNTYDISHASWAGAMTHLHNTRGSLTLPLKGNGYLLETLANHAEKVAAKREQAAIEEQRAGGTSAARTGGMRKAGEVMATQIQPSTPTDAAHKLYVAEKLPEMSEEQAEANRRRVAEMLADAFKGVAP